MNEKGTKKNINKGYKEDNTLKDSEKIVICPQTISRSKLIHTCET